VPALTFPDNAPRSSFNLTEAMDRVRGDLGLRGNARITDVDLQGWLNEAQRIIARESGWCRLSAVEDTTAATGEYAFPQLDGGRCIAIQSIWFNGLPLVPASLSDFDVYEYNWRTMTATTPTHWWTNGATSYQLWPTPSTTQLAVVTVYFLAVPPEISTPTDHFYVPNGWEEGILLYGKKLASQKDAHGEGARRLLDFERDWREFLRSVARGTDRTNPNHVTGFGEEAGAGARQPGGWLPAYTSIGL
jgi:hypothetical protein